jgi:hypothetical protein
MSKPWFVIGILSLNCFTVAAQKEAPQIRNIVLVHGAWADGSGWKGVYDILVKDGYKVSIVQEPETSLRRRSCDEARDRSARRTVRCCRSQLWWSGNHRSRERSQGHGIGLRRGDPQSLRRSEIDS